MYETLSDLYKQNEIDSDALEVAVTLGWISKIEKMQIIAG